MAAASVSGKDKINSVCYAESAVHQELKCAQLFIFQCLKSCFSITGFRKTLFTVCFFARFAAKMDFLPIPTIFNLLLSSHWPAACMIKHLQPQFLPIEEKKNHMISKAKRPIFEVAPEQGSRLHELCGSFNCPVMAALLPGERAE